MNLFYLVNLSWLLIVGIIISYNSILTIKLNIASSS